MLETEKENIIATKNENRQKENTFQYTEMQCRNSTTSQQTLARAEYSVYVTIPFREICIGTLLLPLCSIFICFTTAYIFQPDDIHETHCRVYNIIPSISAITGISPQRYLWRISIAIHIGPRFLIAFAYRNFYRQILEANLAKSLNSSQQVIQIKRLINVLFGLSIIEIVALTGVTYISNRENYPMHEKIFIAFMTASLFYMLLTIVLWNKLYPNGPPTQEEVFSLKMKKIFFTLSILSAILLVIFFAKHRFLCHDMAFSWFATSEYLVALLNMANHITSVFEFSNNHLMVTRKYQAPPPSVDQIGESIPTETVTITTSEQVNKKLN